MQQQADRVGRHLAGERHGEEIAVVQHGGRFRDDPAALGGSAFNQQRFRCDSDGEQARGCRRTNGVGQP